ncbi:MAG: UDP-3-O-(3-hydroxymyristoyl)glucosamine N-acyltransferase [Dechloromonas sp.]|jgi:UDP-3-O-[3-hydroxymyristoyl] glucosamine N-acyltransferase|nr:MAG: UDP-3-O-(3-hydroxymyristoyl)glucosamine N-acyltransferase [Dechloromonas sp.]
MSRQGAVILTLSDIAAQLGGDVLGDGQTEILRVATLASAGAGDIAFLSNRKYRNQLQMTRASAVIVAPPFADDFAGPRIVTGDPYAYYARVAGLLNPDRAGFSGVHPSVASGSPLPASAAVGPHVSIGRDVALGENVVIHAGCVIGDNVTIGDGSLLYANVTIYHGCRLGKRAILHSGAVIGGDGFGFAPEGRQWLKIPQLGSVRIGDDVEIGSNTTVDRGALDDTVIGDGCKIDNLVQVGHNCNIGPHSVLAGCTGIAGSVTLGEHCIVGGAGMISGHVTLAPGTTISGGSLVMKSIAQPGLYTSVFPLDTHDEWVRNAAHIRRLSHLAERVANIEKLLKQAERRD